MRRRVLFVNTPSYIGGAEVSLLTLMRNLERDRFMPELVTSGHGPLLVRTRAADIPSLVQEFPWFSKRRPWSYMGAIGRLTGMVRRQHIDLIHTNCDRSLRYVMWTSRIAGVPYVSHVRDFARTWFEPSNVAALNRAARVVANSQATAQACLEAGVNPQALVTIYNPIDVAAFRAVSADVRAHERNLMGIPGEALVIGLVGQVQPIKGHAEFIAAATQVASQVPDVHFLVVGAPPPDDASVQFAEMIRRQAGDSGFAERFHFAGFRADIPRIMASLDVLVVPSWREPFGRVAAEGMAAGRAVIGTNVGGLPEIITDGEDGLLVPPRDPRGLVTALLRLCEDAGLRERLARQALRTAARYSIDSHVQQVQALYQSVLANRRGAA